MPFVSAQVDHRTILALLVDFQDFPVDATTTEIEQTLFTGPNSVADYFEEVSYGKMTLSGAVEGPLTIPFQSTDPCDFFAWKRAARAEAELAGVEHTRREPSYV